MDAAEPDHPAASGVHSLVPMAPVRGREPDNAALLLLAMGARRIDVTWWGKTGTFALLWAVPFFLAGESTAFAHEAFAIGAWFFGLPGLVISWVAGWSYIPAARAVLAERRSRGGR